MKYSMCFLFIPLVVTIPASAHDYEHPERTDWYMSLKNRQQMPCCDGKDQNHVANEDWGTQQKPKSHYWVIIDAKKYDVPDQKLIDGPNLDGSAMVWSYKTWEGDQGSEEIRCFMPGTLY